MFLFLGAFLVLRAMLLILAYSKTQMSEIDGQRGDYARYDHRAFNLFLLALVCVIGANLVLWLLRPKNIVWPHRLTKRRI